MEPPIPAPGDLGVLVVIEELTTAGFDANDIEALQALETRSVLQVPIWLEGSQVSTP